MTMITSEQYIEGTGGLVFVPGDDTDVALLTVQVTGTPAIAWDESLTRFTTTHGLAPADGTSFGLGTLSNQFDGIFLNDTADILFGSSAGIGFDTDRFDVTHKLRRTRVGGDGDLTLLEVGVTGTPAMDWDESDDRFTLNKGLDLDVGDLILNDGAALATTATSGFIYVPGMSGTPSGTPGDAAAGAVAMVVDDGGATPRLFVYSPGNASWYSVTLT